MPDDSTLPATEFNAAVAENRREIDVIDAQLIELLKRRCEFVQKIGALKHAHAPGRCPLRPGREAEQVRAVAKTFENSSFLPAAASAVWRNIIMSSLTLEGEIKFSVYHAEGAREYYWLAREYFGAFSAFNRQPTAKRVLGDVMDGKAQVGVLPAFAPGQETARWWLDIAGNVPEKPKIFAALPFVHPGKPGMDAPAALAVGFIEPEETGDDLSYLLIDVQEMVSQDKLQSSFAAAGLEARWIEVHSPAPGKRLHLVEVKGFTPAEHPALEKFREPLGRSLIALTFLGAVATPLVL